MISKTELSSLSRVLSHALRHEPWVYELELDEAGWVPVEALLIALRAENPAWSSLSEDDLANMIALSDKKRHELRDGHIRALYGHSMPRRLVKERAEPPSVLFHGTAPEMCKRIKLEGLKPMGRHYVHLSIDIATANQVGRRKAKTPVILSVKASMAWASGVSFYRGNDLVWLADAIPAIFIE